MDFGEVCQCAHKHCYSERLSALSLCLMAMMPLLKEEEGGVELCRPPPKKIHVVVLKLDTSEFHCN